MSCLREEERGLEMMLLCGQSNRVWHWAAGRWPGKVGLLLGPNYFDKTPIDPWMPFALDNDAFSAWSKGVPWSFDSWKEMLGKVRLMTPRKPLWVLVPDVVGNRELTLRNWDSYSSTARKLKAPLAFAVQDGMTVSDVPNDAEIVFVGGTDGWKFPNLKMWVESFPRVHCGRVNSPQMFLRCEELGCESIDGTGWFMDPSRADKLPAVLRFLEGSMEKHPELNLA
jgi:hypothetical protein